MLNTVGTFLAHWIGFTLGLAFLSLLMSGFVLAHAFVGLGFATAVGWMLIDRWRDRTLNS